MADRGDQTVIRRTIIERGVRSSDYSTGGRASTEAMKNFANQHEEENREMHELNTKFGAYLDRVKFLETQNRKLQAQLDDLKQKWGKSFFKSPDNKKKFIINLYCRF
jgi:hypothetical protein